MGGVWCTVSHAYSHTPLTLTLTLTLTLSLSHTSHTSRFADTHVLTIRLWTTSQFKGTPGDLNFGAENMVGRGAHVTQTPTRPGLDHDPDPNPSPRRRFRPQPRPQPQPQA